MRVYSLGRVKEQVLLILHDAVLFLPEAFHGLHKRLWLFVWPAGVLSSLLRIVGKHGSLKKLTISNALQGLKSRYAGGELVFWSTVGTLSMLSLLAAVRRK